jgi:hypothetical protein
MQYHRVLLLLELYMPTASMAVAKSLSGNNIYSSTA